jgi:branched-chain amino acid aminotransferase
VQETGKSEVFAKFKKVGLCLFEKQISSQLKPLPPSRDLGFGKYFTDHWFLSHYSADEGWHDSKIQPYGPLSLDPAASVLHYGQALFEGMKVFRQKDGSLSVFRPHFNWQRLQEGAERLCMICPPEDLFMKGLKELLQVEDRWVPSEENCALYVRPTLIGTEGFLGVRPSQEMLFFILLSPVGSYYAGGAKPVRIWVEDKSLRAAPGGLGATKAGANYAASLKSALDAKKKGFDQVLWLDSKFEGIEEVGTMNVFFVFKNEIVTPALNGSILSGGVRDSVVQLLKHQGHKVSERRITISELIERYDQGDLLEAFGTGTAAVISSIGELQYRDKKIVVNKNEMGPLSLELLKTITGIQRGTLPDIFNWMKPVKEL